MESSCKNGLESVDFHTVCTVCILVWVYMYDFNLYKIQFRFSKKTPHKFYEISQVICQTNRDVSSNSVAFLENLSVYTFADIFNTKIFD